MRSATEPSRWPSTRSTYASAMTPFRPTRDTEAARDRVQDIAVIGTAADGWPYVGTNRPVRRFVPGRLPDRAAAGYPIVLPVRAAGRASAGRADGSVTGSGTAAVRSATATRIR